MPKESANAVLNALINRGLEGAEAVLAEIRRGLKRFTRTTDSWPEYLPKVRRWIFRHEPILARVLSDSLLAGWLQGGELAIKPLPKRPLVPTLVPPPPLPPDFIGVQMPDVPEPIIRFPLIETAARDLAERELMTRADFDALATEAKASAFTVARVSSLDTLEKIQEALIESVNQGKTLRDFRRQVEPVLAETPLSPAHLENVFRTNIAQASAAGLDTILRHPLVADELPYLLYSAVHDSRTRPNHREMEKLGIQRTAVYRRDDPIWERFFPPWDYN